MDSIYVWRALVIVESGFETDMNDFFETLDPEGGANTFVTTLNTSGDPNDPPEYFVCSVACTQEMRDEITNAQDINALHGTIVVWYDLNTEPMRPTAEFATMNSHAPIGIV